MQCGSLVRTQAADNGLKYVGDVQARIESAFEKDLGC